MNITERDIKVLRLINSFGYLRGKTIEDCLFSDLSKSSIRVKTSERLRRLKECGFVSFHKGGVYKGFIYSVTREGGTFLESLGFEFYGSCSEILWGEFKHECYIHDTYLKFRNLGFNTFIPEKEIKKSNVYGAVIPDLVMIRPDNTPVLIEVELSRKSFNRIEKKLVDYSKLNRDFISLYIYESEAVRKAIEKSLFKFPEIKEKFIFHTVSDFFKEESDEKVRELMQ